MEMEEWRLVDTRGNWTSLKDANQLRSGSPKLLVQVLDQKRARLAGVVYRREAAQSGGDETEISITEGTSKIKQFLYSYKEEAWKRAEENRPKLSLTNSTSSNERTKHSSPSIPSQVYEYIRSRARANVSSPVYRQQSSKLNEREEFEYKTVNGTLVVSKRDAPPGIMRASMHEEFCRIDASTTNEPQVIRSKIRHPAHIQTHECGEVKLADMKVNTEALKQFLGANTMAKIWETEQRHSKMKEREKDARQAFGMGELSQPAESLFNQVSSFRIGDRGRDKMNTFWRPSYHVRVPPYAPDGYQEARMEQLALIDKVEEAKAEEQKRQEAKYYADMFDVDKSVYDETNDMSVLARMMEDMEVRDKVMERERKLRRQLEAGDKRIAEAEEWLDKEMPSDFERMHVPRMPYEIYNAVEPITDESMDQGDLQRLIRLINGDEPSITGKKRNVVSSCNRNFELKEVKGVTTVMLTETAGIVVAEDDIKKLHDAQFCCGKTIGWKKKTYCTAAETILCSVVIATYTQTNDFTSPQVWERMLECFDKKGKNKLRDKKRAKRMATAMSTNAPGKKIIDKYIQATNAAKGIDPTSCPAHKPNNASKSGSSTTNKLPQANSDTGSKPARAEAVAPEISTSPAGPSKLNVTSVNEIKAKGMENKGNNCYFIAGLQLLRSVNEFRIELREAGGLDESFGGIHQIDTVAINTLPERRNQYIASVALELRSYVQSKWGIRDMNTVLPVLQNLFSELETGSRRTVNPNLFRNVLKYVDPTFNNNYQHDCYEFLSKLMEVLCRPYQIEAGTGSKLDQCCPFKSFYSETVVRSRCLGCGEQTVNCEHSAFTQISVPCRSISVQAAVNEQFNRETIAEFNCEKCDSSLGVSRTTCMADAPRNMLAILTKYGVRTCANTGVQTPCRMKSNTVCDSVLRIPTKQEGQAEIQHVDYRLTGFVKHVGGTLSLDSGHYTFTKVQRDNKLVLYDDAYVTGPHVSDYRSTNGAERLGDQRNIYIAVYSQVESTGASGRRLEGENSGDNVGEVQEETTHRRAEPERATLDGKEQGFPQSAGESDSDSSLTTSTSESDDEEDKDNHSDSDEEDLQKTKSNAEDLPVIDARERDPRKDESPGGIQSGETEQDMEFSGDEAASNASENESGSETDDDEDNESVRSGEEDAREGDPRKDASPGGIKLGETEQDMEFSGDEVSSNESVNESGSEADDAEFNEKAGSREEGMEKPKRSQKVVTEDGTEAYEKCLGTCSMERAEEILNKATGNSQTHDRLKYPVCKPRVGAMYIYELQSKGDTDYTGDGIKKYMSGSYKKHENVRKDYHTILDNEGKRTKSQLHVYKLHATLKKKGSLALLHYTGNQDDLVVTAHGNSNIGKPYQRSRRSVYQRIREKVAGRATPHEIFVEDVKQGIAKHGENFDEVGPVDVCRNRKQVSNLRTKVNNEVRLDRDEITAIQYMSEVPSGKFIHDIVVGPEVRIVIADPGIIDLTKQVLRASCKYTELKQLISYDTTFNLGDIYVSAMEVRNVFFQKQPIYPVAFLLHRTKDTESHRLFWRRMNELLDLKAVVQNIPFITDKEPGIRAAIREQFEDIKLFVCHNHLKRNVEEWVRKHGGKADDVRATKRQVKRLLRARTEEKWNALYNEYREQWSKYFLAYVEEHKVHDFFTNAKFNYAKIPAFSNCTPTTNVSESENARIKMRLHHKELPVDTLVLALHNMQLSNLMDFKLSLGPLGNHALEKVFSNKGLKIHVPTYAGLDQMEFAKLLKRERSELSKQDKPSGTNSLNAIAKIIAEQQLVTFDSRAGLFTVRSPYEEKPRFVKLNPERQRYECDCTKQRTNCIHVMAVLYGQMPNMAMDSKTLPQFQLSILSKGRAVGKSGRKAPRLGDEDFVVIEAPDSILARKKLRFDDEIDVSCSQDVFDSTMDTDHTPRQHAQSATSEKNNSVKRNISKNISQNSTREGTKEGVTVTEHASGTRSFHPASPEDEARNVEQQHCATSEFTTEARESHETRQAGNNVGHEETEEVSAISEIDEPIHHSTPIRGVKKRTQGSLPKRAKAKRSNQPWLTGTMVENGIAFVIEQARKQDIIAQSPLEMCAFAKKNDFYKMIKVASVGRFLDNDIILQPMNVDVTSTGVHWMLGLIGLTDRFVCILDSKIGTLESRKEHFSILYKIAGAVAASGKLTISAKQWVCAYANDVPQQEGSDNCGIHVVMLAHAIAHNEHIRSTGEISDPRQWMQDEIPAHYQHRPKAYGRSKLSPTLVKFYKQIASWSKAVPKVIFLPIGDTLTGIRERLNNEWSICGSMFCKKNRDAAQSLCVRCRKWYHNCCMEFCKLDKPMPEYLYCTECNPGNEFVLMGERRSFEHYVAEEFGSCQESGMLPINRMDQDDMERTLGGTLNVVTAFEITSIHGATGEMKGIEGERNSDPLDSTLMLMFHSTNIFNLVMLSKPSDNQLQKDFKSALRSLVNNLRLTGYCSNLDMVDFRLLIEQRNDCKTPTSVDDVIRLMQESTGAMHFIQYNDGSEDLMLQTEEIAVASIECVQTQTLADNALAMQRKSVSRSKRLILKMPFSSGKLVRKHGVFPNSQLKIKGLGKSRMRLTGMILDFDGVFVPLVKCKATKKAGHWLMMERGYPNQPQVVRLINLALILESYVTGVPRLRLLAEDGFDLMNNLYICLYETT